MVKAILSIILLFVVKTSFSVEVGEVAPNFSLKSHLGEEVSLRDFKEKVIVLEWFNSGCPFVRKFYDAKKMQSLQKKYRDKVVWLTVSSSAKGKQGYLESAESAKSRYQIEQMNSQALLLDHRGEVGRLYGAKATPHFFIINKKRELVYKGAIDSISSADPADIDKAKNYVDLALNQVLNNNKVAIARTKAYGCSVKY